MKSHLKRLAMPKTWDITRKKTIFVMRPHPGSQPKHLTIPLQILMRDVLKYAKTAKEVRHILNEKEILVNGTRRKEVKFPVGLMDVVEIKELKKCHRMTLNEKGKLIAIDISGDESSLRPQKIINKNNVKKKTQLNFSDGGNLLVDKDTYKTDDVLIYDFSKKKIAEHLKFEKGMTAFMIGGKNIGHIAQIQDVQGKNIILKSEGGVFETMKKYAFVIGKDKPKITVK